jgi:hypothetical protein
MTTRVVLLSVACAAWLAGTAATVIGAQPDADVIAKIVGVQPEVKDGVATVRVPRSDLSVVVDGVKLTPFQGLTTWAAFQKAGEQTMVMGDMTLTENEVNPAMSAALENGLEVTALHNHFLYEQPRVFFMHIGGMGSTEQLAIGVRKALDAVRSADAAGGSGVGGPAVPEKSSIDEASLAAILGEAGQAKDGMVKFVFGRRTAMHGVAAAAAMGVNTWAAFAGSQEAAVVDGDFAMLEDELQGVLKALGHANINVVAVHNHMTHELPRIMFLHYWARGPASELARGVRAALDTQAK